MDIPNPETLEAARELLLQYNDQMTQQQTELETLRTQSSEKDKEINELRTLNQRLFLRIPQGNEEPEEPDEPEQTLEEYAKTLKGLI